MNDVLRLEGIAKTYNPGTPGAVDVLRGLDLSVAQGEVVALVAPSGAGKSTLLHIAGLLDTPDAGRVVLNGRDMTRLPDRTRTEARRREVGFVYQFHHLLPEFDARDNVALPMRIAGLPQAEARRRAEQTLTALGLGERLTHQPAQLSGGEQQRVAIARSLANKPRLLLADEPTGNLDSTSGASIVELLHELHAQGTTIIVITHDNELAAQLPRQIAIRDGRIVGDSSLKEIVHDDVYAPA